MVEYRSPFDVRLDTAAPSWVYVWSRYREDFATAGSWDQKAYDSMLKCVTMDNPPDAPKRRQHRQHRAPGLSLGTFLLLYVTIVGGIAAVVFGVLT